MEAGGTNHCNAWHIDFNKDTLHSKKMYWNRAINPRSKATWGYFGEDSQKLLLISVMASGSYSPHLILMDATALYKDRHHTVVCPYLYSSLIIIIIIIIIILFTDSCLCWKWSLFLSWKWKTPQKYHFCNVQALICDRITKSQLWKIYS